MKIAYSLFLNFCQEKGWEMDFSLGKLSEVMSKLVQHQINKLNLDKKEGPDIIGEFFSLYKEEKILGSVGKGRPKDHNWKKRIYYDRDSDCVYIHGDKMKQMCRELEERFTRTDSKLTPCFVFDALNWQYYLEEVASKYGILFA